jgi:hypothetical protein
MHKEEFVFVLTMTVRGGRELIWILGALGSSLAPATNKLYGYLRIL